MFQQTPAASRRVSGSTTTGRSWLGATYSSIESTGSATTPSKAATLTRDKVFVVGVLLLCVAARWCAPELTGARSAKTRRCRRRSSPTVCLPLCFPENNLKIAGFRVEKVACTSDRCERDRLGYQDKRVNWTLVLRRLSKFQVLG